MKNTKYRIGKTSVGQPAIFSARGLVATMEAGSDSIRSADAITIVNALNDHTELLKALREIIDQADAQFRAGDRYATFNRQTIDAYRNLIGYV
jgi:hypothetical protein